jgi:hypothetical protein
VFKRQQGFRAAHPRRLSGGKNDRGDHGVIDPSRPRRCSPDLHGTTVG